MESKKVRELNKQIGELRHKMRWEEDIFCWYEMDTKVYELQMELEEELAKKRECVKI